MTLYATPEQHAENPPETWRVERVQEVWMPRPVWRLTDSLGHNLEGGRTYTTRKAAQEAAGPTGWAATLYEKESRWYRGETITGWKSYRECRAESLAMEYRRAGDARTFSERMADAYAQIDREEEGVTQ